MLEGRPGVCAEVEGGGGRDGDVGRASFEVATGFPCSHGTIFSQAMEIGIWNLDNKARRKIWIYAGIFFSLMYVLSYMVLPILPHRTLSSQGWR